MEIYRRLDSLPWGRASETITPGCLVIEGGGWRGLYAAGVLDALMVSDINLQTAAGVSAGALCGMGYVCGQIGWAARFDLGFRNDPDYVGRGALRREHAIMGFRYLFNDLMRIYPMDKKRFLDRKQELVAEATNLRTGKPVCFRKNEYHNIIGAIMASASVPYVSRPIMLDGDPYLDGACSEKIMYDWAKDQGFEKIVVVRTRDNAFRQESKPLSAYARVLYHRYPAFMESLDHAEERYNEICDSIQADEDAGRTFVIAPADPVDVKKFDDDLDKLGDLYFRGYNEGMALAPAVKEYVA